MHKLKKDKPAPAVGVVFGIRLRTRLRFGPDSKVLPAEESGLFGDLV